MAYKTFSVRFGSPDPDIAADALAVVINNSTTKGKYVAINEVRIMPRPINDDTTAVGLGGILSIERISAYSGGTDIGTSGAALFDTTYSGSISYPNVIKRPDSVTVTSNTTFRRVSDVQSSYTITKALPFQSMLRAPGVCDSNDHTGRVAESQNIIHKEVDSNLEPITIQSSEGIAIFQKAFGVPHSLHFEIVVKETEFYGATFKYLIDDLGTEELIDKPLFAIYNGGTSMNVYIISMPNMGEENIPRYRLVRTEATDWQFGGTAVTPVLHDTQTTLTSDILAYKGPMRYYPLARTHGAWTDYYDYQTAAASVLQMQKTDTFRQWLAAGPWIRTTGSPAMLAEALTRGEPEVWPGDRRGTGADIQDYIILRPGQGLAVIGGGGGLIETSELAYAEIEMTGFIFTEGDVPVELPSLLLS